MQALGFIETKGFVAAVEAADSAMKAASVSLVGRKLPGSGLVAIIITGDVAAVKAGVEAGAASAAVVGQVVTAQVIANPHEGMKNIIYDGKAAMGEAGDDAPKQRAADKPAAQAKKRTPGI